MQSTYGGHGHGHAMTWILFHDMYPNIIPICTQPHVFNKEKEQIPGSL